MARYWVTGGNGFWNSTTNWATSSGGSSGAAVPTSADDVFFDANSGSGIQANVNVSAVCNNLNLTGWPGGSFLNFGGSHTITISASVTCTGAATNNFQNAGSGGVILNGSGTITSGSSSFSTPLTINASGTYSLADNITINSGVVFSLQGGTFTTNGHQVTCDAFKLSNSPTLNMGASLFNLGATGGTVFGLTSGATVNAGTSTVQFNLTGGGGDGGGAPAIVDLQGQTVYYLYFPAASGYYSVSYVRFKTSGTVYQMDAIQGTKFKSVAAITTTLTNLNLQGASANHISWQSETNGSQYNICTTNSNVTYTDFKDVNFSCTKVGNNTDTCTSNCTNIDTTTPITVTQRGGAEILLML